MAFYLNRNNAFYSKYFNCGGFELSFLMHLNLQDKSAQGEISANRKLYLINIFSIKQGSL